MLIKEGYKQTEAGLIPENWIFTTINELVENNILYKPLDGNHGNIHPKSSDFVSDGIPFVMANNVQNGKVDISNCNFLKKEQADNLQKGFSINGDVLFTHKGTVGNVAIVQDITTEYVMLTPQVTYYRVKDENRISKYYIKQYFLGGFFQKHIENISGGGTRAYIGITGQRQLPFILPPLKEQTAIATALSDADGLITSIEKLIAKKRNIKQGVMQQLLQPKKGWEVKKLGECAFITKLAGFEYSLHFNSYKDEGEIIVIGGTNITNNKLDLRDIKTIPAATSKKLPRSKLFKNDLVFAYVGTIGPIYLIQEDDIFHLGPNTCKITVNKGIDSKYVYHYFTSESIKKEITEHTSIGAQPSLSMTKIRSFNIPVPNYNEQIRIATILSDMDAELTALEQKMEKYKKIKLGMMQELLTGRTRLV